MRYSALLLAAVVLLAPLASPRMAHATPSPVRILAVGDSFTYGSPGSTPDESGYRCSLFHRLAVLGYAVEAVGSQQTGLCLRRANEGHGGWTVAQIDAVILGWLTTYQPHVVLVLLGTNDAYTLQHGASGRMAALLDRIATSAPSIDIVVSSLPPMNAALAGTERASLVEKFNAALPGVVAAQRYAGHRVWLADAGGRLTAADLRSEDGIHPSPAGYQRLAEGWLPALLAVMAAPSPDAVPGLCNPRPPLDVATQKLGAGRLAVTITVLGKGNSVAAFQLVEADNVSWTDLAATTSSNSFTLVAQDAGLPTHAGYRLTDACGEQTGALDHAANGF